MAYYIRKIARSKWQESQLSTDEDEAIEEVKRVKADAITNCIKTTGNKLSLWVGQKGSADKKCCQAVSRRRRY